MTDQSLALVFDIPSTVAEVNYDIERGLLAQRGVDLVVPSTEEELNRVLPRATVVISAGLEPITAEQIGRMSSCHGIVVTQGAIDQIDVKAAASFGIEVVNMIPDHRLTAERVLRLLEELELVERVVPLSGTDVELSAIHHLDQLEGIAEMRLSPTTFGYVAGGAGLERGVRNNRVALDRIDLVPRVLRDVAEVSTTTTILGDPIRHPLIVAPSAVQRLSHLSGELATARAARDATLTMVLSMNASTTMEDVSATGVDFWMQLYMSRDRDYMRGIIGRASDAGAKALCITVDHAGMPTRLRELSRPLVVPPDIRFVHLDQDPAKRGVDRTLDWGVIEWVREVSDLPIVLKGVLHPDDGRLAVEAGVDGLIVSNHGGRQLDSAVSAYDVLIPLLEAVDGQAEVYADGGIRSGNDLFKVIALGARAGLIGRPIWWGLAAAGEEGVARVLELLTVEFEETMRLCGTGSLDDIHRDLLRGYLR